jgi:hypothetical protein
MSPGLDPDFKSELNVKLPGQARAATYGQEVQDKEDKGDVGAARSMNYNKSCKTTWTGQSSYPWAGGPGQGERRRCWCRQKSALKRVKLPGQGRAATCGQEIQGKENKGNVGAARRLN